MLMLAEQQILPKVFDLSWNLIKIFRLWKVKSQRILVAFVFYPPTVITVSIIIA